MLSLDYGFPVKQGITREDVIEIVAECIDEFIGEALNGEV